MGKSMANLQNYLIDKSKEELKAGNCEMAKSWLLTCGALFPQSFTLQVCL